ncbi:MAG: dipicolinate synthase subunit DpsA [Alicyclobacillus sp.]|nr:dipicolinate synthase subunit DpsA [Alicyclobacillus sp.]
MLTGRKLVFVGGDARMAEVLKQVTDLDASAVLIGFDKLEQVFPDTVRANLDPEVFADADALVLPVAGMDDDGRIDSQFTDTPLRMTEAHFRAMRPGTYVFSGIGRPVLEAWCTNAELRLVKLMELDEVAILNSIPTAEGAIAMAMQHTDVTIHGANVAVLGFGRCGQTLARTLAALGARVSVGARNPAHLARIQEMALQAFHMQNLIPAIVDAEIVFNTIPHPTLTAAVLTRMRKDCVIIDIASKPGGTDFRYAERHGIKAMLAPSLPGIVAPKTAGRIIASTISRILET